jgi:hypothetical protein
VREDLCCHQSKLVVLIPGSPGWGGGKDDQALGDDKPSDPKIVVIIVKRIFDKQHLPDK